MTEEDERLKYLANCVRLARECIERGDHAAGAKHLEAATQLLVDAIALARKEVQ